MSSAFKWNLSKNNDNEILIRKHLHITTKVNIVKQPKNNEARLPLANLSALSW